MFMYARHMDISPDTLQRTDRRINALGSKLLFHPATLAHAAGKGFDNAVLLYAGGRAGAMGDVAWPAVASAFGFFNPDVVAAMWPQVEALARPSDVGRLYAESLAAGARELFADDEAAAVVARVGWALADAVHPMGYALFSGWRALRVADDDRGAAGLALMTLRELRGDVHIQCVAAAGLHPLEAEMVTRGADGARLHGWPEPFPDPAAFTEAVAAAEAETTRRMVGYYARLPEDDVAAFAGAVAALAGSI
jgi:hypothetical protein